MIIGFTGSRPLKLGGYKLPNPIYNKVCQELEKLLLELKPEKCITGLAQGFDQYAANVCIRLGIPIICAIPFEGQEAIWPEESKRIYKIILARSAEQVIVSQGGYQAHKLQLRNQYIVDNCDLLIACDGEPGSPGGTANCVAYAEKVNRKIYHIAPSLFLI